MGNVHIGHQQIIIANASDITTIHRTPGNSDILTNGIIVADFQPGGFTGKLQILWLLTNRCKLENTVIFTNTSRTIDEPQWGPIQVPAAISTCAPIML